MHIFLKLKTATVVFALCILGASGIAFGQEASPSHGLVGLRPLPRNIYDLAHRKSWEGLPTFDQQKGKYPFVAKNIDVVYGWWPTSDFHTKKVFFEHYWGLNERRDDLNPRKNQLVKEIKRCEAKGREVAHILLAREYRLLVNRGFPNAEPGPFKEDNRILFSKDIDQIRALLAKAHKIGLLKHPRYKLIQMVDDASFFSDNAKAQSIVKKMDGVAFESHQFNNHWPFKKGWSKPEKVVRGALWTLAQGKEYILYYGPILWKSKHYKKFIERDWLFTYWNEGLPKNHPRMHYYLNTFPHAYGRGRPIGPETDPHSVLGFTNWLIHEIKMLPQPGQTSFNEKATN